MTWVIEEKANKNEKGRDISVVKKFKISKAFALAIKDCGFVSLWKDYFISKVGL